MYAFSDFGNFQHLKAEQGISRPFPIRPLLIGEVQFQSEQARLISPIRPPPEEIDPGPRSSAFSPGSRFLTLNSLGEHLRIVQLAECFFDLRMVIKPAAVGFPRQIHRSSCDAPQNPATCIRRAEDR